MEEWTLFTIEAIPTCQGVYGIYMPARHQWFYIGKAQNIVARIKKTYHPFSIAISLGEPMEYYYIAVLTGLASKERELIGRHTPIGNGGTTGSCGLYPDGQEVSLFAGWNPDLQCSL